MPTSDATVDPRLDAAALRALALLPAPPAWVPARADTAHDVAIVGGGQNGVALAFALKRMGVARITVIDTASEADTGVWRAPARMNVLRTPKHLTGPELDLAELSFRHWYEARHGQDAYDAIGFIARTDWAAYLDWFRAITGVAVRHGTTLEQVLPDAQGVRLRIRHAGRTQQEIARKLVLANGVAGFGGPSLPDFVHELPAQAYAHTAHAIDFSRLRGRTVAVLGSAASAFDAAATALEQGAQAVHLFARRPVLTHRAAARARGHAGAAPNFHLLPDAARWQLNIAARRHGTTPPREALLRLAPHTQRLRIHRGAALHDVAFRDGQVHFRNGHRVWAVDFLILGTGYHNDAARVSALSELAPSIAAWSDRYPAPAGQEDSVLERAPYLGPDFELTEKRPGDQPSLRHIHVYSAAASTSFGRPIGDVPCMGLHVPQLARAIARDLYFADLDAHLEQALAEPPDEFPASLYGTLPGGLPETTQAQAFSEKA